MRCDLHVHTIHSGMCTVPVLNRVCRESYNDPREVYETLKRRGMQLVTVTDHDSIGAAEHLSRHPDFFLSEEVTCRTSNGTELHVGVYGLDQRDHVQLQRRRDDFPRFLAYLRERSLLFSVNHVFSSLTGRRTEADFREFAECFPAVETRNGQVLPATNLFAARFARRNRQIKIGGSDSHTLHGLGRTFTEVPGARTPAEYLAGLRAGWSRIYGESGNYWKLTTAVLDIGCSMIREHPWTALLAPLFAVAPMVTLGNTILETAFAHKWGSRHAPKRRLTGSKGVQTAEAPLGA